MACYPCTHCNKCGMYSAKAVVVCADCGEPIGIGTASCKNCGSSKTKMVAETDADAKTASRG